MTPENTQRNIDVIIPTYLRGEILGERLASYWNQPETKSIIIVDSGSDLTTEKMIENKKQFSPVPLHYFRFPEQTSLQNSKNFGITKCDAPYVFIGEDDIELPSGHFSVLLETLERNQVDIVGGRRIYIRDGESMEDAIKNAPTYTEIFHRIPFEAYFEANFQGEISVPYIHSNPLIRRGVFDSVLYDDRYKGNSFREELDFYLGCLRKGVKIIATSKTTCFHLKSPRKNNSGCQMPRYKYEFYVWVNTLKCFWKNRDMFKAHFNMKIPLVYGLLSLFARYINASKRRIVKKNGTA